jgi:hypothetical protein
MMIDIHTLFLVLVFVALVIFAHLIDKKQKQKSETFIDADPLIHTSSLVAPIVDSKASTASITAPPSLPASDHGGKQTLTTHLDNMAPLLVPTAEEVEVGFMSNMVDVLEEGKRIPNNWQGTTLCVDAIDMEKIKKGNNGTYTKIQRSGYFIRLVNRSRKDEFSLSNDLANLRIGVFDRCGVHLVQSIAYGYRLPVKKPVINISIIPKSQQTNLVRLLQTTYDIIFAYIIPGSKFEALIYSQPVYMLGFDKLDITRINVTFPYMTLKKSYMSDVYDWKNKETPQAIYPKEGTMKLLWTSMFLFIIGDPKNVPPANGNIETFITRLQVSPEMSDPTYSCYGEPTNENRALCNSSYDAWGNLKEERTYWDVRCIENTDCPFYKANKNYPNEYGRCMPDGICEMPVGIRRTSFIKYQDEFPFMPMCYGCSPEIADCCKDQKDNPDKYPLFVSPDYAFVNDIGQREPRGLDVMVPLPTNF